jgi:hypothetical protein
MAEGKMVPALKKWVDFADGAAVRIAMTVAAPGKGEGILEKVIIEQARADGGNEVTLLRTSGGIPVEKKEAPHSCGAGESAVDESREARSPSAPLPPSRQECRDSLLTRLVALNHERAAEEKRGLIRWQPCRLLSPWWSGSELSRIWFHGDFRKLFTAGSDSIFSEIPGIPRLATPRPGSGHRRRPDLENLCQQSGSNRE